uniref:EGF-like domain-containing protein n=1 Tax=Tetraodon nigroviridis TaxID=99883 RepID=H3C2F0_TETNG
NRFNATVIVKTDYDELVSQDGGLLNHTRLLHAMVTGALRQNVSIRYMDSWPVDPYRTATALLLSCPFDLHNVTSKLLLLLKHIEEVSSVTVEDIDECKLPTLHHCLPSAECHNSLGSYRCICHQGYVDADPSDPGADCRAPAVISSLWSANVTGTSFCVYWSSRAQTSQVYRVVVEKGAETLHVWETPENTMAVPGLGPGVLYTVTVTPRGCGQPVHVAVRTGTLMNSTKYTVDGTNMTG